LPPENDKNIEKEKINFEEIKNKKFWNEELNEEMKILNEKKDAVFLYRKEIINSLFLKKKKKK